MNIGIHLQLNEYQLLRYWILHWYLIIKKKARPALTRFHFQMIEMINRKFLYIYFLSARISIWKVSLSRVQPLISIDFFPSSSTSIDTRRPTSQQSIVVCCAIVWYRHARLPMLLRINTSFFFGCRSQTPTSSCFAHRALILFTSVIIISQTTHNEASQLSTLSVWRALRFSELSGHIT